MNRWLQKESTDKQEFGHGVYDSYSGLLSRETTEGSGSGSGDESPKYGIVRGLDSAPGRGPLARR